MALRGLSVIGCRLSEVSVHVVDSGHARRRPLQYRLHDHRQRAQRRQPTTDNARSAGATLRKDIVIAIAGIVIVAAICFGLAIMKQIAATMTMPAMAMTMSFLKVAPEIGRAHV